MTNSWTIGFAARGQSWLMSRIGSGRRKIAGAFLSQAELARASRARGECRLHVAPEWRNKGLGRLLGTTMLHCAKQLGYRSVIFNLVFSENLIARKSWEQLDICQLGVIPGAHPQERWGISRRDHHVSVVRELTVFLRGSRHSILLEMSSHQHFDCSEVAFRKIFETASALDKGFLGS